MKAPMKTPRHPWSFRPRLRARALGWRGSSLAIQRLKEALAEIKVANRSDPALAAEGAVLLMERRWMAFEGIDSSSGCLGNAVSNTVHELNRGLSPVSPSENRPRLGRFDRIGEPPVGDQMVEPHGQEKFLPVARRFWIVAVDHVVAHIHHAPRDSFQDHQDIEKGDLNGVVPIGGAGFFLIQIQVLATRAVEPGEMAPALPGEFQRRPPERLVVARRGGAGETARGVDAMPIKNAADWGMAGRLR